MTPSHLPKTSARRSAPFRLGDLEVLPASGEVRGPAGVQRLRPLLVDILLRLAQEPGEVVRRETLLEEVWPRRMVNDEVLSRAIAELRTALGDDARSARYIETLPKIGYRLVAAVSAPDAGTPTSAAAGSSPGAFSAPGWVRMVAGAFAALAAGTAVLLATAPPQRSPAPGRIEASIAAARVFTSDPALEIGPRFSPDGRAIAFALGEGNASRIVIQSIADSTRRAVGDGADLRLSPVFFPDGGRIAYWRLSGPECAIVEHDLASGVERRLVDCALSPRPRFDLSRDGKRVVFSGQAHPQAPAGLWLVEAGGAPVALTAPQPGIGDDLLPRFSPDGRQVAFFRGNESHRRPWVVDLDGARSARAIGTVEGLSYGLAWLGARGPLIAAADWLGFRALNVLDPASGEARLAGGRGARSPDVGPAGEIVWEHAEYSANLWLLARGAEPRALWRATRYTSQPEFSPDGKRIVFASNRDGTDAIYVAEMEGAPRRVAFGDAHRYMRPHWSADGRSVHAVRVALPGKGDAAPEAVRIPADGGAAEVLALPGPVADVRESRDGRWVYWGVAAGDAIHLWRAPRDAPARSERLPLPAMSQYQMNAEWIVFAQPQLARLGACRLDSLACAPLEPELEAGDLYHWSLGPRSLYLRVREGGRPAIARIDLASGKRVELIAGAPGGAGGSIAVAPDEASLVIAREEGPTVDLMLAK